MRSAWLLLARDFKARSVITKSVHLHILTCRSQDSSMFRLQVAKTKTKAFKLFFFLLKRSHSKCVIEKRSIEQMNFTTFDFATFKRHVFREAFLKTTGKIWKRMLS